jgi:hypothetical protein
LPQSVFALRIRRQAALPVMDAGAAQDKMKDVAYDLRIAGIARPAPVPFTFDGQALMAPRGRCWPRP